MRFLSTHSKRSATVLRHGFLAGDAYFYPRTPNGVRQERIGVIVSFLDFYPRTPNGVRRITLTRGDTAVLISIHALQTECDLRARPWSAHSLCNFYPRTPNGVRPWRTSIPITPIRRFLSTHSKRSATTATTRLIGG